MIGYGNASAEPIVTQGPYHADDTLFRTNITEVGCDLASIAYWQEPWLAAFVSQKFRVCKAMALNPPYEL